MKQEVWSVWALAAIAVVFSAGTVTAQGVTSAAVAGRVTDEAGAPVATALVTLTNASTGQRYSRRAADDRRYNFENVAVGGPYTLQTRALGFETSRSTPFQLALGQRDRKSTRLNSSHLVISYAVFCLKKKKLTACSDQP